MAEISPEKDVEVLAAQVAWLRTLLIQLGPPKVQEGVRNIWLREFVDEGLVKIRHDLLFRDIMDDDIPF